MMKRVGHIACLLLLLTVPSGLISQELAQEGDRIAFFKNRAWQDAKNEQNLQYTHLEDERDYWNDQRNFEKALKKLSYLTYQTYLAAKKDAYDEHATVCNDSCNHGVYYYNMSAFYKQHGVVNAMYLDPKETQSESISSVSKKKH